MKSRLARKIVRRWARESWRPLDPRARVRWARERRRLIAKLDSIGAFGGPAHAAWLGEWVKYARRWLARPDEGLFGVAALASGGARRGDGTASVERRARPSSPSLPALPSASGDALAISRTYDATSDATRQAPVAPDEVLRPGTSWRARDAARARAQDAVRGAGGGQPWLLPSVEGLAQAADAKRGPDGRPIPANPAMRRKKP